MLGAAARAVAAGSSIGGAGGSSSAIDIETGATSCAETTFTAAYSGVTVSGSRLATFTVALTGRALM